MSTKKKFTGKKGNPKGNPQNLAPQWQPGQSGNPNGRPKGSVSITTVWKSLLELPVAEFEKVTGITLTGETAAEMRRRGIVMRDTIAGSAIVRAMKGDMTAFKEILDRTEGTVAQALKLGGDAENPTPIKVEHDANTAGTILGILARAGAIKPPTGSGDGSKGK